MILQIPAPFARPGDLRNCTLDIVAFLDFLLQYSYSLPYRIKLEQELVKGVRKALARHSIPNWSSDSPQRFNDH